MELALFPSLLPWASGLELRLSGSHSKCFSLLSVLPHEIGFLTGQRLTK